MTNLFIRVGLATGIIRQHQPALHGQQAGMANVAHGAAPASTQQAPASKLGQSTTRPQSPVSAAPAAAAEQQQHRQSTSAGSQATQAQPGSVAPAQPPRSPASQQTPVARVSQPPASTSVPGGVIATPVRTDIMQALAKGKDIDTVFPVEAKFNGDLEIDEHFVIKGVFRGSITQTGTHSLLIGNTGGVHGNVCSHQLIVGGTIEGDVCANEVIILETGKIVGNVTYEKLAVELGGEVHGRIQKEVFNVVAGQSTGAQSAEPSAAQPAASGSPTDTQGNAWATPEPSSPAFGGLHAVPTPDRGSGGVPGEQTHDADGAYDHVPEANVA